MEFTQVVKNRYSCKHFSGKKIEDDKLEAILATHMLLAVANAGVDSCWINFFNPDQLAEELKPPPNHLRLMILQQPLCSCD